MTAALLAIAACASVTACDSHLDARIGGVVLPQAYSVVPAPDAPLVVLGKDGAPATLPPGPVRVAIDLRTPWSEIHPALDAGLRAGSQPILLVGQRHRIRGFVLDDAPGTDPAIRLYPDASGKFCLSPPDNDEKYCVEAGDHRHISSIYVREAIRRAVAEYRMTRIRVYPTEDVPWGDLVRTVDGARSCCKQQVVAVTVAR